MESNRVKIVEIFTNESSEFLDYCSIAGKIYCDELAPIDYVAFRSQFGYSRDEVKALRAYIDSYVPKLDSDDGDICSDGETQVSEGIIQEIIEDIPFDKEYARPKKIHDYIDKEEEPQRSTCGTVDMSAGCQPETTFAQLYNLNPNDFANVYISSIPIATKTSAEAFSLSNRSINALKRAGCFTVKDLLNYSSGSLFGIKNMGAKSVQEICDFAASIASHKGEHPFRDVSVDRDVKSNETGIRHSVLRDITLAKIRGMDIDTTELTETEVAYINKCDEAQEVLGREFCLSLLDGTASIEALLSIIAVFRKFSDDGIIARNAKRQAEDFLKKVSPALLDKRIRPFAEAYWHKNQKNIDALLIRSLHENLLFREFPCWVADYMNRCHDTASEAADAFIQFENWVLDADIDRLCDHLFASVKDRSWHSTEILRRRASGETLAAIADEEGCTRERIRQKEAKAIRQFVDKFLHCKYNLFLVIYAYIGRDHILQREDIAATIGEERTLILWYCLNRHELDSAHSHYNERLHAVEVTVSEEQSDDEIQSLEAIVEELPTFIETVKLEETLKEISKNRNISLKILKMIVNERYKAYGVFSCKSRLTVIQMCDYILKNRFPNGYKIADETDSGLFINYMNELFGNSGRTTPRAIDAKIMDLGVLCDRGKYIHKDYVSVDSAVVEQIISYIEESPRLTFTYTELYAALSELFVGTQISNRYFLQGIMKLYGNKYTSHKDYISKEGGGNVADELTSFVKIKGVVHKSEIFEEFPGWQNYNLGFILPRCHEIIGVDSGYFIHSSALHLTDSDYAQIEKYMDMTINDTPVSCRRLLDEFTIRFTDFILRNAIETHGKLFGILQYMFGDKYHFSRPYIAKEKSGTITNKSVILQHLDGADSIEMDDLVDICNQNALSYVSASSLFESIRPEFIRINESVLMRKDSVGITDEIMCDVVELVVEAVKAHNGYIAAKNITDFSWYPLLNVPWTPFLLESVVGFVPTEISIIRMQSTRRDIPQAIFVAEEYADDDWNSLIVKVLKKEHTIEPFATKTDIHAWLQQEGLCNVNYPLFLDSENHVYFNEEGRLVVE